MPELVNTDLIHIQHCHVSVHKSKTEPIKWKIRKNISGDVLHELQMNITENEIIAKIVVLPIRFAPV